MRRYLNFLPALSWAVITSFLTLVPGENLGGLFLWKIPGMDKLAHAGFYAVQSFLSFLPLRSLKLKEKDLVLKVLSLLFLFGAIMELLQYYIPNRTFDLVDILANTAGILLGYIAIRFVRKST